MTGSMGRQQRNDGLCPESNQDADASLTYQDAKTNGFNAVCSAETVHCSCFFSFFFFYESKIIVMAFAFSR